MSDKTLYGVLLDTVETKENLSEELLFLIFNTGATRKDRALLVKLAKRDDLPQKIEEKLTKYKQADVQSAVLSKLNSSKLKEVLKNETRITVLKALAKTKEANAEILEELAERDEVSILVEVYKNANASIETKRKSGIKIWEAVVVQKKFTMSLRRNLVNFFRSDEKNLFAAFGNVNDSDLTLLQAVVRRPHAPLSVQKDAARQLASLQDSYRFLDAFFYRNDLKISVFSEYIKKYQEIKGTESQIEPIFGKGLSASTLKKEMRLVLTNTYEGETLSTNLAITHAVLSENFGSFIEKGFDLEKSLITSNIEPDTLIHKIRNDKTLLHVLEVAFRTNRYRGWGTPSWSNLKNPTKTAKEILSITSTMENASLRQIRLSAADALLRAESDYSNVDALPWQMVYEGQRFRSNMKAAIMERLIETLEDDPKAWEIFNGLSSSHEGTVGQLIEVTKTFV